MTPKPIIAIEYTPAYEQGGGIGRYVRELVAAVGRVASEDAAYRLFVAGASKRTMPEDVPTGFAWYPTPIKPVWWARIWHRARLPLPVEAIVGRVNLFHATDFVLPPTLPSTRTILTVHDLSFVRVPESASPSLKRYLDQVVPRSVRRADLVLADSQATKDDIVDLYGLSPDRIRVLLSGVDVSFKPSSVVFMTIRKKYNLPDRPYLFSIGTVQPRKNYVRLVQALALLRSRGHDLSLVIAGGKGWLEDPIYSAIRDSGMQEYVHFIGFADEQDLPALYTHAECFVFVSLYEGFGLPILESMGCGTPVVTSNVSSLPEVTGDAGLMVDPYDIEAIADAITRILEDSALRDTLTARGLARVKQFTWENSARQLIDIYRQTLT